MDVSTVADGSITRPNIEPSKLAPGPSTRSQTQFEQASRAFFKLWLKRVMPKKLAACGTPPASTKSQVMPTALPSQAQSGKPLVPGSSSLSPPPRNGSKVAPHPQQPISNEIANFYSRPPYSVSIQTPLQLMLELELEPKGTIPKITDLV